MKSDALLKKVCVKLNFGQKDGVKWNMIESSGSLSLSGSVVKKNRDKVSVYSYSGIRSIDLVLVDETR